MNNEHENQGNMGINQPKDRALSHYWGWVVVCHKGDTEPHSIAHVDFTLIVIPLPQPTNS